MVIRLDRILSPKCAQYGRGKEERSVFIAYVSLLPRQSIVKAYFSQMYSKIWTSAINSAQPQSSQPVQHNMKTIKYGTCTDKRKCWCSLHRKA